MNEKFANIIRQRIYQRVPIQQLINAGINEFYVGGNSLNKNPPNDIDIFPVNKLFTELEASKLGTIVSSTKNAITVKMGKNTVDHQTVDGVNKIENEGTIIQLCNYSHESLEKLVNSFDFSHIQIGAKVTPNNIDVYYTEHYEDSKLSQSTEYVGSEYPISSLIRAFKYAKRGDFAGNSHIFSVLKLITDIVHRGFEDFPDFKDQLDAVDLGLVTEEDLKDAGFNDNEEVLHKLMNIIMLGKQAIEKDAKISYEYAKATGERFVKGELAISKNAQYSLAYARDIIKGRFELGENIISENSKDIYYYCMFLKSCNLDCPEDLHNIMLGRSLGDDRYARSYMTDIRTKVA